MTAQKLFAFCFSSLLGGGLFLALPQAAYAAALQLSPPGGTVGVDGTIQVKINLSLASGESVSGVDAELTFDENKLQVTAVQDGTLFPTYPVSTYSNTEGTIAVSGLAQTGSSVTAGGTLATITFKGKSGGTAAVTFDFTSGSTTDSNVAQKDTDTDLLESVVNGSYTVSGSGGVGGGSSSGTDTGTGLPTTGNQETTLALFLGGLSVLGLGSVWRFLRA
jgi:LPXTG-motif cell wall-anchored protein